MACPRRGPYRGGRDAGPGRVDPPALSVRDGPPRDPGPAAPAGGALSCRGVAPVRGVGVGRWRRWVDRVVALEDDPGWDLPGDLVLSIDEAAFRGTARCIPSALRAPARRVLPIRADDRLAPRDAWWARIPTSVRARLRGGCLDMKVAYANALRRACPRGAVLVDPFHIIPDATARGEEARRLEQTLTQQTIRRGPRIQGVEHRRPRQPEALAPIQTTYPALGPRHRLKEDWRTLRYASDLTAATAPRNRGLINAAAARRRRLPRGPDAPPMAARAVGALATGPAVHPRVHRGLPHQDQEPEAPELWVPQPRSLSPEDVARFRPPIQIPQGLT